LPEISVSKFHVEDRELPTICWNAVAALISGWLVGVLTAGIFPQLHAFNVGVWLLYAWFTSFMVYAVLRAIGIHKAVNSVQRIESTLSRVA
jgi:hypothetical protein